ncbi:MAG: YgiT-type zinc finger protein [Defluviitaleaceae bacterium]|nr:YgiT-type zinc finger protein [Defluviitaleaceae bacterium]MCL2262051.1 YgiT-type zinc finger protein [Defluviitaleaceae bacterium]
MKCVVCKGELKKATTSEFKDFQNRIIFVRDIPCHKCSECGEFVFSLKVGVRVEEIIDTLKESLTAEIAVVQYSLTEIKAVQYSETVAA